VSLFPHTVDDAAGNSPVDGQNDSTHLVALNGSVRAFYPFSNTVSIDSKLAKIEKEIDVEIIIFRKSTGGSAVISTSTVQDHWKIVEERFAQVGIKVNWTIKSGSPFDPPPGIDFSDPLDEFYTYTDDNWNNVASDTETIINAHGGTSSINDIQAFYVKNLRTDPVEDLIAKGAALWTLNLITSDAGFANNILINADFSSSNLRFVSAHELGHLFLLTHDSKPWNIMHVPTSLGNEDIIINSELYNP